MYGPVRRAISLLGLRCTSHTPPQLEPCSNCERDSESILVVIEHTSQCLFNGDKISFPFTMKIAF
jgi:hypothetical protein